MLFGVEARAVRDVQEAYALVDIACRLSMDACVSH